MKQGVVNKLQAFFPAYPIEKAWIFGSYARGEETRKSDVDIMVRFEKDADISLLDYVKIMNSLKGFLRKKIDMVEEGQLYPWAQESVDKEKILVYERKN
jgi:predicted nucleotidyltransferase